MGPRLFALTVLALMASTTPAPAAETIRVTIDKLNFAPAQVSAHVGDTIEWINADFVAHTATARDGAWDVLIPVKTTKSIVLKAEGVVDYYCKFHPNMTGRVSVTK